MSLTSENEADSIYGFSSEYIKIGGRSIEFIDGYIKEKHEISKKVIMCNAAIIDEFLFNEPVTRVAYNKYCMKELIEELGDDIIEDTIEEPIFDFMDTVPELDLLSILLEAGLNISDAYRLVDNYEKCLKRFVF